MRAITSNPLVLGVTAVLALAATAAAAPSLLTSSPATDAQVGLATNGGHAPMFQAPNMRPGVVASRCVTLTTSGTSTALAGVFSQVTGTGLDRYLTLTIERGPTIPAGYPSCAGFEPDTANTLGLGSGVLYRGALDGVPSTEAGALMDPTVWPAHSSATYRFTLQVADDRAAEGLSVGVSFRFGVNVGPALALAPGATSTPVAASPAAAVATARPSAPRVTAAPPGLFIGGYTTRGGRLQLAVSGSTPGLANVLLYLHTGPGAARPGGGRGQALLSRGAINVTPRGSVVLSLRPSRAALRFLRTHPGSQVHVYGTLDEAAGGRDVTLTKLAAGPIRSWLNHIGGKR